MEKKLIFIDIDNTMYDSSQYRSKMFKKIGEQFAKEGITNGETVAHAVYESFRAEGLGFFDPEKFVELCIAKTGAKKTKPADISAIIYSPEMLKGNFYAEVQDVLVRLSKIGTLGIYSQGIHSLQKAKIDEILHFFHADLIFVVRSKKETAGDIFKEFPDAKIYFIDDALPILQKVKSGHTNVFTIWIQRGRYAAVQQPIEGFVPDAIIDDLSKAAEIINKN